MSVTLAKSTASSTSPFWDRAIVFLNAWKPSLHETCFQSQILKTGLAERQTNTLTWQNSPLFSDIYQWAVREKPTCAVMWPASCMSATSAELLMALRECVRGLRERGVEPVSSRGLTWAWWRRGLAGGEQSYQSRVPGTRHGKICLSPSFLHLPFKLPSHMNLICVWTTNLWETTQKWFELISGRDLTLSEVKESNLWRLKCLNQEENASWVPFPFIMALYCKSTFTFAAQ